MNGEQREALSAGVAALEGAENPHYFLYCPADVDNEPLLLVQADPISVRQSMGVRRTAVERTLVKGEIRLSGGRPVLRTEEASNETIRDHLKGPLAELAAPLGRAVVLDLNEPEPEGDEAPAEAAPEVPAEAPAEAPAPEGAPAEEAPAPEVVAAPEPQPVVVAPPVAPPPPPARPAPPPARPVAPARPAAAERPEVTLLRRMRALPGTAAALAASQAADAAARAPLGAARDAEVKLAEAEAAVSALIPSVAGPLGANTLSRARPALDALSAASRAARTARAAAAPLLDEVQATRGALIDAVIEANDPELNGAAAALAAANAALPWIPEAPLGEDEPPAALPGPIAPVLDALARRVRSAKDAAGKVKAAPRTKVASEFFTEAPPVAEVDALLASAGDAAGAAALSTALGHVLDAVAAMVDANKQVSHMLGWKAQLAPEQLAVLSSSAETLGGLISGNLEQAARLARAR